MLKENFQILRRVAMAFDMGVVAAGFFSVSFYEKLSFIWFLPVLLLLWAYLLNRFGMYQSLRTRDILELLHIVFKSAFFGLLIVSSGIFLLKDARVDREFIGVVFVVVTILLCLEKIALVIVFRLIRVRGFNYRNILIVGLNKRVENFIAILRSHPEWGLRILGIVDEEKARSGEVFNGVKVIGCFQDMASLIHKNVVDEVVFIVPRSQLGKIEDIILLCETEGIKMDIAADFFNLKFARSRPSELEGFPLLTFETTTDKLWHLMAKRLMDFTLSALALLILLPFILALALLIKLISSGPAFFRQERMGLKGRRFFLYKFRSMIPDAEGRLHELMDSNEMRGPVFKMKNDPRIIPVIGKFLRRFSIDELPQLWNVLKGQMSLVGPRPPLPNEVSQYDNWHRRRMSMRPGITCLWQTGGRNRIADFDNWIKLDLEYIDNWSLWLDLKILLKTIPAVLLGIGAN
jgi:exopolysaccharide biosynthesis polyprenyl glycosylphosphotransferase